MTKREFWRMAAILACVLAALFYLYPTCQFYWTPPGQPDELERVKRESLNLGLDLQGGIHLVLEVDPGRLSQDQRRDVVDRVKEILVNRIDQFGVAEPIVHREGDWRIVVELPGVQDVERAKNLIGRTARLEFRILKLEGDLAALVDRIEASLKGKGGEASDEVFAENGVSLKRDLQVYGGDVVVPADRVQAVRRILNLAEVQRLLPGDAEFLWGNEVEQMGDGEKYRRLYYVYNRVEMSGEIVQDARARQGASVEYAGQAIIEFTTTGEGVKRFAQVTSERLGERMAIVLDRQVFSAPTIQAKIRDGRAVITGSKTMEEAKDLAIVLRAGALPADVKIIEDRMVGPSLGRDSIEQGKRAAAVGLIAVTVFMAVYYGFSGLVANLALGLNVLFILAVLAGFHGTLTLPGIAGIVLTMGMAVDANVLIFERIREELRAGKSVYAAVKTGYSRAFLTIVDANLTTVISALVLYQFGTGPVRGFALTLMIGIAASMFTAIFVTRTVFDFVIRRWQPVSLSIGRLHLFRDVCFDFLRARRVAYTVSVLVILMGLGSAVVKRGYDLGIDFTGGTLLEFHFERPVAAVALREALEAVPVNGRTVDLRNSEIKLFGSPNDILVRVKQEAEGTQTADAIKSVLKNRFASSIGNEEDWLRRQEAVGPKIGSELRMDAIQAILVSIVLIALYIWWRFKHVEFGVGAVAALAHDVLVTLGVFSLLDRAISLSVVAALLTIVGYSLNDTIVIYDRVREDLGRYRREGLGEVLNRANNECLSRTVITAGTTLFTVVALMVLGGEILYDFALALFVGIVAGTYSSVFVATPIVLEWENFVKRARPVARRATQ